MTFYEGRSSDFKSQSSSLLKCCKWDNGVCQEKVFFAKNNLKLAVLTENMSEYKTALEDMKKREFCKKGKKTNKFTYGHNYVNLSENLYFFDSICRYKLLNKNSFIYENPDERKTFFRKDIFLGYSGGTLKFSDYLKGLKNVLSITNGSEFVKNCPHVFYLGYCYNIGDNIPQKVIGPDDIEFSENWKDELYTFEVFLRERIEEVIAEEVFSEEPRTWLIQYLLSCFGYTSFPEKIPELKLKTIKGLKLLRKIELPFYP